MAEYEFNEYFPPLRRKILKSFLLLILVVGLLGLILIGSIFFATTLTPKIIHRNYDSIAAAHEMRKSWWGLHRSSELPSASGEDLRRRFEEALVFEEGNITEPGEKEAAQTVRRSWEEFKADPSPTRSSRFTLVLESLDQIILLNEKALFHIVAESHVLSRRILAGALVFFLACLLISILLADRLAQRLSKPIKDIAELLRGRPSLGNRLKLPEPSTLELFILNRELKDLWNRLGILEKLNLKQLVTQKNQLETVLASVEDGILVLNNQERVVLCNEGMGKILGLEPDQVLSYAWKDLPTLQDNYLKLRDFLKPELGENNSIELNLEGLKVIVAARYRPIFDEENQQVGSLYLLHDITQKRYRGRLKEEFISVLSHELKTPLQSLGTASELIAKRKEELPENLKILAETLQEDVSRIRATVNDFVQVGQAEIHSLKLKLKEVPLNERLSDWIKPFKVLGQDRRIEVDYRFPEERTVWANLDEVKFPWVVSNLLSNALRVSEPGGRVTVSLEPKTKVSEIIVSDQGPGISKEVETKMFDPFFQGSGNVPMAGFLGLGLTIAKEVVEAHGGRIEYRAVPEGGSSFRITLPAVEEGS